MEKNCVSEDSLWKWTLVGAVNGAMFCIFIFHNVTIAQDGKAASRVEKTLPVFGGVEPRVRHESKVPPRLPGFLPYADEKKPLFVNLLSASDTGYEIVWGWVEGCEGGNACLYGSLHGSAQPLGLVDENEQKGVPVRLKGNIEGRFFEAVCNAHCSESYIEWKEDNFYYAIGMEAEKKEILLRVANSAIPSR
jgi:hypothetical protein